MGPLVFRIVLLLFFWQTAALKPLGPSGTLGAWVPRVESLRTWLLALDPPALLLLLVCLEWASGEATWLSVRAQGRRTDSTNGDFPWLEVYY